MPVEPYMLLAARSDHGFDCHMVRRQTGWVEQRQRVKLRLKDTGKQQGGGRAALRVRR